MTKPYRDFLKSLPTIGVFKCFAYQSVNGHSYVKVKDEQQKTITVIAYSFFRKLGAYLTSDRTIDTERMKQDLKKWEDWKAEVAEKKAKKLESMKSKSRVAGPF